MGDLVRIFGNADDLDPELYACSQCGRLWSSMIAAQRCCDD